MKLLVLVLLAGCDMVMGLTPRETPPDSTTIDAPAPKCAAGEPTRQVLPAVADAMISSGTPAQSFGTLGVVTISTDIGPAGSRGLFRFDVGTMDASAILELHLVLPSAIRSNECNASCGPCAGIEHAGNLRAFPVRSAWIESEVTWTRASAALAWQSGGASGPSDRGAELGTAGATVGGETSFVGSAVAALAWREGTALSFVVESIGAKQTVRTGENTCDGGASPARLELLACL